MQQLPEKDPARDPHSGFQAHSVKLAPGISSKRFSRRLDLLKMLDRQRHELEQSAEVEQYDPERQLAISLLAGKEVRHALDVTRADEKIQERYGKNSFGWSLLMAFRMVQAGVNLVQVNLGNNEAWDTHGEAFWRLREKLLPPTDRALSALLDDLNGSGLLDSTLIVMGGEFGRTPPAKQDPPRGEFGGMTVAKYDTSRGELAGRPPAKQETIGGTSPAK